LIAGLGSCRHGNVINTLWRQFGIAAKQFAEDVND
jgi:hypothetical protein